MSNIPPCPHCGVIDSVYRNVRASGYTKEYFDTLEYSGEMPNTDTLRFTHPKRLRCCRCHKVRRDVKIEDDNYLLRIEML